MPSAVVIFSILIMTHEDEFIMCDDEHCGRCLVRTTVQDILDNAFHNSISPVIRQLVRERWGGVIRLCFTDLDDVNVGGKCACGVQEKSNIFRVEHLGTILH
jgi:hypothetical protein